MQLQLDASLSIMSLEEQDISDKICQTTGYGDPGEEVDYCISDTQTNQLRYFGQNLLRAGLAAASCYFTEAEKLHHGKRATDADFPGRIHSSVCS